MEQEFRFWRKVDKSKACWNWTGALTKGYGYLSKDSKKYYAHRYSWIIHNGLIPENLCVLHKCDNPLCVNPDHLFLGTTLDNVKDKIAKGRNRWGSCFGEKNGFSKLNNEKVLAIKQHRSEGKSLCKIAEIIGVSKSTVGNVLTGKNWRNING